MAYNSVATCGKVLCGRTLAQVIGQKIKTDVSFLKSNYNICPKLVVIEIGANPESVLYIKQKKKFAANFGVHLSHVQIPSLNSESMVLDYLNELNVDSSVHGIMLQLPIHSDKNIDLVNILNSVIAHKDVEGLGAVNNALLNRNDIICTYCDGLKQKVHIPCTAAACFAFIRHVNFPLVGSNCVIIGHGRLVGAPTAQLLINTGRATVTLCHIDTKNLAEEVLRGDIIISGVGQPELIKGGWIKPGALVIDCGYSVIKDPNSPNLLKSVGDVQFSSARERAQWITPVPGGVGPLSIAMLLRNTVNSAKWSVGLESWICNCS